MSISCLDAKVSLFHGSTTTHPCEVTELAVVLDRIQSGVYRPTIARLRALVARGQLRAYRSAKERSVAFTPSCALQSRDKAQPWGEKLLGCTGLVHFDVDHLEDPAQLKAKLALSRHVVFVFVSPSGHGLKIGIAATGITGPETYRHAWDILYGVLTKDLPDVQVNGDAHVKFLHALCFVSDDPDLYVNRDAVPFVIPPAIAKPPRPRLPLTLDAARVESALTAIPNHDADYQTWLVVGMALQSTGTAWAEALWETWSRQSGKFDERKQAKSWQSFTADGKVQIGTLFYLAAQHGWHAPRSTPRTIPNFAAPPPHLTAWLGPREQWHGLPFTVERIA